MDVWDAIYQEAVKRGWKPVGPADSRMLLSPYPDEHGKEPIAQASLIFTFMKAKEVQLASGNGKEIEWILWETLNVGEAMCHDCAGKHHKPTTGGIRKWLHATWAKFSA